mgnify:CR=1 FL=1
MKVLLTDAISASNYFENGEIDCIITSPPYFQCRNYNDNDKQIGLEKTVEDYVDSLCEVFDSYKHKLNERGNLFVNIGDKYDKSKNLLLIPYLFATEMQKRGWILRNDIIWHKPNFQPSPVKDRLANAYEHVFHFVKNKNYYYDLDSIRVPNRCDEGGNEKVFERFEAKIKNSNLSDEEKRNCLVELEKLYGEQKINKDARLKLRDSSKPLFGGDMKLSGRARELEEKGYCFHCNNPKGKNMGDVLSINVKSHHGSHEAVYPSELVQPLIKCGSPNGGLVVDCFSGSGTTIREAERLNRVGVGVEINRLYVEEMSVKNLEIVEY